MSRSIGDARSEYERELVEQIAGGDWRVTAVFAKVESDGPPFAYSIGLYENFAHPEILMIGPDAKSAATYVNRCGAQIKAAGKVFAAGEFYSGILDNLDVFMTEANNQAKNEYALSCNWYYSGEDYPLLQCVWPSNKGFWPWDDIAWDDYKALQPLYGSPPLVG